MKSMAKTSVKNRFWEIVNGLSVACVLAIAGFIVSVNSDIAVAQEKIKSQEAVLASIVISLKEMRKEAKKDRKEIIKGLHRNTTQNSVIEARVINLEKR